MRSQQPWRQEGGEDREIICGKGWAASEGKDPATEAPPNGGKGAIEAGVVEGGGAGEVNGGGIGSKGGEAVAGAPQGKRGEAAVVNVRVTLAKGDGCGCKVGV
mgnify:CR=1 FL=1